MLGRKESEIEVERDGGLGPLNKDLLYVQVERRIEELLVRGRYRVGDRIPPELELVKTLGVSRVTVRAGLAQLVERGMLEPRRGSGTFLVRPSANGRLRVGPMGLQLDSGEAGSGKLETYTSIAERLGLRLDGRGLRIEAVGASPEEAATLEVPEGARLAKVSRVLLVEGEPAAWMVDAVPEESLPVGRIKERLRPGAMLLDLLVSEGVSVGYSELFVEAVTIGPDDHVGGVLGMASPSAALSLIETMHLTDGRPVQWSRNTFLPGNLNLHVVRELSGRRDPS